MAVGAYCRIRLNSGQIIDLEPGDIIGRLETATLRINEPQISEAHALISLRGEKMMLLALRGVLSVGGRPTSSVQLRPGTEVMLCQQSQLTVLHTELPDTALGARIGEGRVEVLRRSTYSLMPGGILSPLFQPAAIAYLWSSPEGWLARVGGEAARTVHAGDSLTAGGWTLQLVDVPLDKRSVAPTMPIGGLFRPMRIVTRYETVLFYRDGVPPVQVGGLPARLISELAGFSSPTPWRMLAEQLWPGTTDAVLLRQRLDRCLARLRRKLRRAELRTDLVQASGSGDYELLLYPGDELLEQE